MLARVKARHAFFKRSSTAKGIDVDDLTASAAHCCILVDRSFLITGPVSSAEESGHVPTNRDDASVVVQKGRAGGLKVTYLHGPIGSSILKACIRRSGITPQNRVPFNHSLVNVFVHRFSRMNH